ncbi:hypothetical protein PSN45_003412 [Yamadazyma tenuis]|uniref:uncharacterized protein n=1 Tax=Candida tenuis TaxID=2315449 RepID=UPI00279D7B06|nr:hypothetical protein PSN45_003412 [Yamadazyma tenuis]
MLESKQVVEQISRKDYVRSEFFIAPTQSIKENEYDDKLDNVATSQFDNHEGDNQSMKIKKLNSEKAEILNKNYQLNEHVKQLTKQLESMNVQSNYFIEDLENSSSSDPSKSSKPPSTYKPESFKISGETSELGNKYYGPQSSSFMIETLKNTQFINDNNSSRNYLDIDSDIKFEGSLIKKPLPKLKPGISTSENLNIIYRLVEKFFSNLSSNYYKTFISKHQLLDFVRDYPNIDNNIWENDDDLLLLIMVLIISIIRITPVELRDIFNLPSSECGAYIDNLIHNDLIYNFEKLRHNLVNESTLTIQSYILCTEYYFIEQRYEECWSMMFHTCSIAYSIGLHVTQRLKLNKLNDIDLNTNIDTTLDENEYDEMEDITKLKIWFSLRILSDKVCSVLGRPNPISFQVNSIILKYNQNYSNINLRKNTTSILLRIGLSECLRLSNMMLIENFMIDFTMTDLLNLSSEFEKEIYLLELYLTEIENDSSHASTEIVSSTTSNSSGGHGGVSEIVGSVSTSYEINDSNGSDGHDSFNELSYDESNYLPIKIEKIDLLNDLVVFYINKAKLFEPFIVKFNKADDDSILILTNLTNSIINFLKLIITIFREFEEKISKKRVYYLKVGKYFRINFPFLNSFIYQGIVIIFTMLNYKSKDFAKLKFNEKFDNQGFLKSLKSQLTILLDINQSFEERIWSINTIYLINRNLGLIESIEKHIYQNNFDEEFANALLNQPNFQQQQSQSAANNLGIINGSPISINSNTQCTSNYLMNFNFNDPFWITNPDNLPYYLGSPNQEFHNQAEEETKHNNFKDMEIDSESRGSFRSTQFIQNQTHHEQPLTQPGKEFTSLNDQFNQTQIGKPKLSFDEEKHKKIKLDDFIHSEFDKQN